MCSPGRGRAQAMQSECHERDNETRERKEEGLHASLFFLLSSFSFFPVPFLTLLDTTTLIFSPPPSQPPAPPPPCAPPLTGATYCSRLSSHRPRGVVSVTRDPHYRHERPEYTPQPPCHIQRSSPLTLTHPDFREALSHVLPPLLYNDRLVGVIYTSLLAVRRTSCLTSLRNDGGTIDVIHEFETPRSPITMC